MPLLNYLFKCYVVGSNYGASLINKGLRFINGKSIPVWGKSCPINVASSVDYYYNSCYGMTEGVNKDYYEWWLVVVVIS